LQQFHLGIVQRPNLRYIAIMQNEQNNVAAIQSVQISFTLDEANRILYLIDAALAAKRLEVVYEAGYFFSKISEPFNPQKLKNKETETKKEDENGRPDDKV